MEGLRMSDTSREIRLSPDLATLSVGAAAISLFGIGSATVGLTLTAATVAGVVLLFLCNLNAKISLVILLCAIGFMPYWWGIVVLGYVPAAALVGLAVLPGALIRGIRQGSYAIVSVLLLAVFIALLIVSGASMPGHGFVLLAQWIPAFLVGYALTQQAGLDFVRAAITVVFTLVAICAIVEYFAGWNPFSGTAPITEQYAKLGTLQARGGITRSEWSFGHSIALANSLALAIPMVLTSKFGAIVRAFALVAILIAIVTTFSRSGLISAGLALVFTLWASKGGLSRQSRTTLTLTVLITTIVAVPWIQGVFTAASTEASRSADHRFRLLDLIPHLNAFGTADGYYETGGVFEWFGVISIDNAFLRLAVNFGWVLGALLLLAAVWIFVRAFRRIVTPPEIALASIMPALLTVALITQFAIFVWFFIGVAAAWTAGVSRSNQDVEAGSNELESAS
jgi:hypothetical protein